MRKITITIALLCIAAFAQQKGTFKDTRDGKTYKTVKIGKQTWMAQNMNYLPETAPAPVTAATPATQTPVKAAQSGGWGLSAAGFSSTANSALPDQEISVSMQFKNTAAEELPGGTKGAALLGNGGEIVAVIGSGGFGKMPSGFQDKTPVAIKCKIPQTVAPGKYTLRLVIQRKGETEWKVVSDAVGNVPTAIEFTVNGPPSKTGSWCYDDKDANCDKYGRLYTFETATGVCPVGWHLPSYDDLEILNQTVGTKKKVRECSNTMGGAVCENRVILVDGWKKLKAKSGFAKCEYEDDSGRSKSKVGNGTDNYGFSALPAGTRYNNGSFSEVGSQGSWWRGEAASSWSMDSCADYDILESGGSTDATYGLSVRCLKD